MIKSESSLKDVNREIKEVFGFLSNPKNIEPRIPKDKIKNFWADETSLGFKIEMLGDVKMYIEEKLPYHTIKFSGNKDSSMPFTMWIELYEKPNNKTMMRLSIHVEVNLMMKMIVEPILKNGIDLIADNIAEGLNTPGQ